ncbi:single-stranded-DNA-specific exonuclease RecJ, partial [Bacteriovoracaceae bacterium]|nr:single-stranded-DNA-specific exonuclease RecJ [Bacteriovoracaceae bacterium]
MNVTQATEHQLDPKISQILEKRGITAQEAESFFSWNLREIPALNQLIDLPKAAARVIEAIQKQQLIGIYGDYDVDGTTSCALLHHFFKRLGIEVKVYQPSRFVEGYGIHPSSIETAAKDKVSVLMTVDCGITNFEAGEAAKEKGIDLIITDHHQDNPEKRPDAYAIVNPNRSDEPKDNPLKVLAGVGVAFCLCLEIKQQLMDQGQETPSLYPLLEFVAIGTIADLAKLNHVNRVLCRHGLKQMKESAFEGVKVFTTPDDRALDLIPADRISFGIGPVINSKGRLDHPEKAFQLLASEQHPQAFELFNALQMSNQERKQIQKEVFLQARQAVLEEMKDPHYISLAYQEDWHEGVIGIVASQLVEAFKTSAIVFTNSEEEGVIKASARAAGQVNMFEILTECQDLFLKFGGHKAAAGLSMKKENLPYLKERLNTIISEQYSELQRINIDVPELELKFDDLNPEFAKQLERMQPFGMGNPLPLFRSRHLKLNNFTLLKDVHVRWEFVNKYPSDNFYAQKINGISFNYIDKWETLHPKEIFEKQQSEDMTVDFYL